MSPWEKLLEHPRCGEHFVQLYASDESALIHNACGYLGEGLRRGDGVLAITITEHLQSFSRQLCDQGVDVEGSIASGRLLFLEAHQTLAGFTTAGRPDCM